MTIMMMAVMAMTITMITTMTVTTTTIMTMERLMVFVLVGQTSMVATAFERSENHC